MSPPSNRKKSIATVLGKRNDEHLQMRQFLAGPNGSALLDWLMDEYVYNVADTTDPIQMAKNIGAIDLVLRLRRYTTE